MKKLIIAAAALSIAGPALAADLPVKQLQLEPPAFSWTGFYVGGNIGGIDNTNTSGGGIGGFNYNQANSAIGVLGGAQIGYNYQIGAIVAGLEADYDFSSAKRTTNFWDTTISYDANISGVATVRGRLGYAVDRALFYATGGWAYGHLQNSVYTSDPFYIDNPPGSFSQDSWKSGYVVGGGLEYAITDHWSAKVEGLYLDFGSTSVPCQMAGGAACTFGGFAYPVGWSQSQELLARLGLNYKL